MSDAQHDHGDHAAHGHHRHDHRAARGHHHQGMVSRGAEGGRLKWVLIITAVFMIADGVVPRGAMVILWGLLIALPGAVRLMIRDIVRYYSSARQRVPVVIYGAGSAGHQLATALLQGSKSTGLPSTG